jgi:hypothetical protein
VDILLWRRKRRGGGRAHFDVGTLYLDDSGATRSPYVACDEKGPLRCASSGTSEGPRPR